jgi:hypothetical protein
MMIAGGAAVALGFRTLSEARQVAKVSKWILWKIDTDATLS